MSGETNPSGFPNSSPEANRGELIDLMAENANLFAFKEHAKTVEAICKMKPEQYTDYRERITKQINFRRENNIHNAAT